MDEDELGQNSEGDEAEEDPLAGLEEEQRVAAEAAVQAALSRREAELKAQYEQEFQGHKAAFAEAESKRWQQRLRDRAGIELRDDGELVVANPLHAATALAGVKPAKQDEDPGPAPDAWDPEFPAWNQRNTARQVNAAVEAAVAPLLKRLDSVMGYVAQQSTDPAYEQAKAVLTDFGIGALAETDEYRVAFQQAYQQIPLEQRPDPQAAQAAALFALGQVRQQARTLTSGANGNGAEAPPRNAQGQFQPRAPVSTAAARAGLSQTRASTGGTGRPPEQYTEEDRANAEAAGMETWEWVALDKDQSGETYRREKAARERAAAGRR